MENQISIFPFIVPMSPTGTFSSLTCTLQGNQLFLTMSELNSTFVTFQKHADVVSILIHRWTCIENASDEIFAQYLTAR